MISRLSIESKSCGGRKRESRTLEGYGSLAEGVNFDISSSLTADSYQWLLNPFLHDPATLTLHFDIAYRKGHIVFTATFLELILKFGCGASPSRTGKVGAHNFKIDTYGVEQSDSVWLCALDNLHILHKIRVGCATGCCLLW